MNSLVQSKRVHKKTVLSTWSGCSRHADDPWFLSFQMVQNKHKEAILYSFFGFFPIKDPNQLKGVFLTEEGNTHIIPNKEHQLP